jgi:Pyridoxal-phosphate dependent enzyme
MATTWFITGTSSGFGRLLTEHLLGRGDRVGATARGAGRSPRRTRRPPRFGCGRRWLAMTTARPTPTHVQDVAAAEPAPGIVGMDAIRLAAQRLDNVAHRTPVLTSRTLDTLTGATVLMKAENFQRAGAFKFRGAYNKIASLTPEQLARGVCAWSSGNHAQAVALASSLLGTAATVLMPIDAPTTKRAATEGYGASVVTYDRYTEDREALAAELANDRGLTAIPAYDDPLVMAGQGTAALELVDDAGRLAGYGAFDLRTDIGQARQEDEPVLADLFIADETARRVHRKVA